MTLAPERSMEKSPNISYVFSDLRKTFLRITSLIGWFVFAPLEHIGMDNSLLYTADKQYREFRNNSYLDAICEFKRI